MAPTKIIPCKFFAQGFCRNGDSCNFIHKRNTSTQNHFGPVASAFPAIMPPQQVHLDAISRDPYLGQQDESSQAPSDSRARVPCKFLSRLGGCQNGSCPYLHAVDDHKVEKISRQYFEVNEDEASSHFPDLSEVGIDAMNRTKSVTTILLGISQEHQSTSMNSATFSKSPSLQTSLLHALPALRQEPLLKQSSISSVA